MKGMPGMSEECLQYLGVLDLVGQGHHQLLVVLHGPPDGDVRVVVAAPGSPAHSIAHVPAWRRGENVVFSQVSTHQA